MSEIIDKFDPATSALRVLSRSDEVPQLEVLFDNYDPELLKEAYIDYLHVVKDLAELNTIDAELIAKVRKLSKDLGMASLSASHIGAVELL
jgi:hypothetical protein